MIALATLCAVSVLFRTVGQPFEVLESAAARIRESTSGRGRSTSSSSSANGLFPPAPSQTQVTFDAGISECLQQIILTGKSQVKAGLALFDVPALDPLVVGPVYVTDDIDFFFRLRNVSIAGIIDGINTRNLRVEYNTRDRRIYLVVESLSIKFRSPYDLELRLGRLMPSFFEPGYSVRSTGLATADLLGFDLKAFVEFKSEPAWGQRLVLDSTYLDFGFANSTWVFKSDNPSTDKLVKYMRLVAEHKDALDPVVEVLRPSITKAFNKFIYETMRSVFSNVILL